ncbi:T9SS type B sorting domain-containing protein [Tenacibaculum ovolyticum]|uniref:T9SS type B sorting domain-containing protein n=1 Tax=Tenacibaculum ovolyticum TaxID=104270 RepID=UPI0022F3DD67|nr:T9SS type B sorting domain-containing protein [Tenacibaculum ovolyticum]WBX77941.1 T9SS type B sorting domain-containing protein [Tenacibaculum ovolyticum]
MSDGRTAWGVYSGTYTVPVGQSTTVIAFDAVSTASGSISVGNFIDDVKITIARNNCIPVSIPLIEPTPVAFTVTPEVCYDGTNGTLTVNVTSGNGNYLYSLDGGTTTQASNIFTGLTDGTYNVTVTDGLSCTIPPVSATINPQITGTVVPTNEICNTLGVITITPGGGDGNYQYVVTPVAPTVGAVITTTTSPINVSAGTYSVSVRDQGGAVGYCEYSENVTITRIADPTVVVTAVQPDCSGGTGTVNIAISNGTSNYTTTLTLQGAPGTVHTSGPSSDAAISFGTLAEGIYDVLVTDANGCTNALPETVTITAPNAITGDSRQSQDYTCLQLGEITVENVVGGTPPYTYTLSDGTTTTTHTTDTVTFDHVFTGLTDGSYTVTISDVNTCNFVTTPTVVIPALPTAPGLTSAVAYNCDGTGNITITALPAGVYNYTLGATTNTTGIFNDLSDGTYTVTVDYGSDCTVDVVNITILDNQEFTAVVTNQTNPVCIGDTNGTIEVTASFPSTVPTDFDYSLDGGGTWIASGANPFTIPNLDNITYNILVKPTGAPVTDCNITLDPVVLSDPSPIVVAATVTKDITCDADPSLDGATITITPTTSGGNGAAYTYELFDNATATGAAVQVGAPFTDIDIAGDYWVVAIDVESCRSIPVLVNVPDKAALAFTVTPEVCYNGTNGTLTVNITSGNGNYLYSLDGGTTTQASNIFTGLTDGTYNVTVIDGFECTTTEPATINPQITGTVVPTNEICNTLGVITITPGGGDGNYQYVVTPVAPTVGAVITTTTSPINVSAGTYSVSVRDQGGAVGYCEYSENVTITRIADPTVVVTAVQPDCSGGTGTVNIAISNGTSNYTTTLTLQGAPGTVHTSGPSSDAAISFGTLAEGTYDVLVTDANGCTNALPETVTITAPNAITGDSRQSQDYTCLQLGEITVENVVGGTPPYTYTLSDGTTTTTHTTDTVTFDHVFTGLTDGSYTVTISDVNTCNFVTTPTVVIPALPTAPGLTSAVAYNCDGTGNITITALPAGVYNYTLGATTNTTGIFNDLSDGTYTVTVDYGSDCTVDVVNITILDNQEFTAVVTNQTNPVCIGDTNGTIEVTASFPSTVPTDFDYSLDGGGTWIASGANPFIIPNLDNITYNILVKPTGAPVTDCNITLDPVVLSDPSPIVVAATVTKDITCDADPSLDGATITITPTTSGGNGAAYTYELFDNATATGAAVQVGAPFTDIDIAGDYWVVAIDVESCRSIPVLVNVPDKAALAFTVTPEVCYNGTNGTLTVNITSGNGNYLYSLDGGTTTQASNIFTGLTDGTYNVTVIDGFECTTTEPATINPQITGTVVPTNEICNTLGVITITPGGGDGNYQYVVTPVAPTVGAVITTTTSPINVSAGTYSVSVRDQGGAVGYCEYSENVTITRIADPTVVVTAVQPDCSGGTGTVNIAISNGTSNYTTTLTLQGAPGTVHTSGPSSDAAISFGTLAEGTYDVLVTDANGCTNALPETVTITAPNAITGDSRQSQDYTCLQLGEITVENVVGGTPPYTYTLSDGTTTTTHTTDTVTFDHVFTGLTDGSYTVTISDVNTCNFVTTPTVVIPALPTAPGLTSAVAYNCDGTGNITITALPAGVYNYTLGATTNTTGIFNDLSDGTYTVTVDYGSDCTVDVVNITILDNQEFTAVVTNQTNPVCIGDTNGTIEVTASFPSTVPTDFDYSLDGGGTWIASGANPFIIPNLDNITYNILVKPTGAPVTDCNITLDPVVLSDPSPIVVAATVTKDITCDADPSLDGATITITPTTSGGNGAAYTYELFDNATATGAAVQVGAPFTDIDIAGDYWVVAIDVESCRSTPVLVNVPVRETIVFTAVPQCYDGANGVIDINITSGNGTYEFSLDGTTWQTPTPANATSFSITGLSNIAYTVEIRDIKGCTQTENVTINNALVATATPTNASCIPLGTPTGQIEVFPTGGSTTGYEFSVVTDGSTAGVFSATNPITNLAAGTYDVYVRDDANCEFIIQDVVIEQITPVTITITDNQPTCNGRTGSIKGVITANTGQSPHTITIADSGGIIVARTLAGFIGTNFNFDNLPAETYTVEITDDLGCTDSQSVTLVDPPALTISIVPERPICGTPFALGTNETLFGYDFTGFPTILAPNKLQFSVDNGVTWQDSPIFRGTDGSPDFNYGTVTFPAIRITDIATESITYCFNSIGSYTMPFEVSPLVVNVTTNSADCTAGAEAVVNVSGGVGNYQYTYNTIQVAPGPSGWQPAGLGTAATTYTFSGLTPGRTYYFFVKDLGDNDCVKVDDTFIIDIDVVITPSILSQSCNGGNTGSLQFDIDDTTSNLLTGGVPAINWELFSLNVVTGVSTSVETGTQGSLAPILPTGNGTLSPGTYYLEIENNAGTCTFASPNIEILETAPINANLTVVSDITCSTNGVISVNATGGTGPYTYSVASSVNFLPADATVSGTTIEFAYADVTDPTLDVTGINITITDSNGNSCSTTVGPESLIVGQLPNIISSTPNSCGVNKTITTRVNSGTGPYQFSVDAGAFSSSIALDGGLGYAEFIAENLTPGNHIITIRDANGCTVTTNSDIQQSLEYTVTSTKNLTCDTPSPADEATYDVNVTSGSGVYTYEITGTVSGVVITAGTALPSNPFTFSTAVAEDYTIIITDTAETPNCTLTKTFEVKAALQPVFTTNVVDATCNGGANGSIGVSVTTGLTPYTYSIVQTAGSGLLAGQATWDAASSSFIAVPAGTYTVTVTGDNGCSTDELNIIVEDNPLLTVTAPLAVQFACAANTNNVQNATLSINALAGSGVSGGSTVYSTVRLYHDVNGDNPADNSTNRADDVEVTTVSVTGTDHVFIITDVAGGSYYVEVVDSASCMSLSASTTINAFDAITDITITQTKAIDCTTGDNITVKTLTDIANVTYNIISAPAGYVGSTAELVVLGTSSASFTDLPTGTYEITATHPVTGCVFTKEYTVDAEPAFTAIANNPQTTCFGVSGGSIDVSFDVSTPYTLGYDYEVLTSAGASLVPAVTGSGVGNVTETIAGLPAGTYYVSINMSPNTPFCTIQTNEFTIVEPTAILSVTGLVDPGVSCTGISDATITATGADGFGGYTYQLEVTGAPNVPYRAGDAFATNLNNNVFTGLPAGNYTIRVRDVNGCEGASADVLVAAPVAVTFGVTELDNSCDTSVGGSITVTAAGGTGSYTYILTNGAGAEVGNTGVIATTTHTFANLSADDYTVSVTDSNGCAAPAGTAITISEDLVFSLATTKDLTCSAPMAGTVAITVASGSGNYTYEIAGPSAVVVAGTAFISGQTFSPTVAGTYTVTVTDEDASPAACPVVRTIDIAAALQPVFTTNVVDATCNGGANGIIGVSVTTGLTPYTYSIVQTAGSGLLAGQATWDAASSSFIAVPAGTYTVTVTGDNGCSTDELNIIVEDNPLLTVTAPLAVQFACAANTNNVQNATLSINALAGSGVSGGSTVYSTVRLYHDVNGDNPADNSTNRADDVEVTTVSVTGTDHVFIITDVAGGSYYVEVVDSASCMSLSASTTINAFDAITDITITQTKAIDCTTGDNITVKTLTDIANVTYNIISAPAGYVGSTAELVVLGTSSASFTDLPTGTYEITATHPVTGCVFTKEYTVDAEPAFTAIANNPQTTCFGVSGGSIDVSFDVSTPYTLGYDYEVLTSAGASLVPAVTGSGVGNVTETIAGLPAGTYYVSINMSPNTPFCTIQTNEFTIVEPTAILSVTGLVDPGVSCTGISDATITATGADGFGGYTYQLEVTGAPNVPYRAGDAFATNLNNNVFTGLPAGNYTIRVRDVNGCEGASADVLVAAPVAVTFGVTELDNSCDTSVGGSITVTAAGGTGSYTYILTNGAGAEVGNTGVIATTTHTFANLSADDYTVSVTDSNGCAAPAGTAITISEDLVFSLATTKDLTCSAPMAGTVAITVASGSGNYTYEIAGPSAVVVAGTAFISGQTFSPTVAGTYTVTVTDEDASPAACPVVRTIDIAAALQPVFTTNVVDATCNGGANGIIGVSVTTGLTPYTYSIVQTAGSGLLAGQATWDAASSSFIAVPAGTYTVTVTGDNGCSTDELNIIVEDNPLLTVTAPLAVQFACAANTNNVQNATLSINALAGSGVSGGSTVYSTVRLYHDVNGDNPADNSTNRADDVEVTTVSVTGTDHVFIITDVAGGSYYVEVVDSASCMSLSASTTINAFDAITDITITQTKAIDCTTGDNITVKTLTDIANVTYNIISAPAGYVGSTAELVVLGTSSASFTDLPTGTYEITATHPVTGCVFTKEYTVDAEPAFTAIANNPQTTCFGVSGGSIDVSFDVSTPYTLGYDYEVLTSAGASLVPAVTGSGVGNVTETIAGLPAGTYYVSINMSPNTPFCTIQTNEFTIVEPTAILSVTGLVDPGVSCTGISDATITATGADGFGGYTYQLEVTGAPNVPYRAGDAFATNLNNNVFTGLPAGNYTIRVRDVNGCEGASADVLVAAPVAVTFGVTELDNSCDTSVGGSITVTAAGGTGSYTYILTNGAGAEVGNTGVIATTTHTFANLSADDYTVSVTDSNGCAAPAGTAITISEDLVFSLATTKDLTCSAPMAGTVAITVASGSGNYTYEIAGPSAVVVAGTAFISGQTFSPTVAGTYTVTVTDEDASPAACPVVRTIDIAVEKQPIFTATAVIDDICNGSSDGAISMTPVNNGISPLTYTIAPIAGTLDVATSTFEDLPAGIYTITATGTNGCSSIRNVTITENADIDISGAVTISEFGCTAGNETNNAVVSVNTVGVGGTGNFVRAVFVYDNGTPGDTTDDLTQDSGVFSYTVANELGGQITVTVFDDNNCSDTTIRTINPFARITGVTVTSQKTIDCNNGEDIIATYSSTIAIANVEYRLYNDTTGLLLEPIRTIDGDFISLLATGNYRIEIENTDTNCVFTEYYTVDETPEYELIVNNIQRACSGGNGSVDLTFNPSTPYVDIYSYEVFNVGGVTTGQIGNGIGNAVTTINTLPGGDYYIVVNMPNTPFCTVTSGNFTIEEPANALTLSEELTYLKCNVLTSGEVDLTAQGGWGAYQYELINTTTSVTIQNFDNNNVITGLEAGNYQATVRDASNCIEVITFQLDPGTTITGSYTVTPNDCIGEYTATIEAINVLGGQLQDAPISYMYALEYPDGTRTTTQVSPIFTNLSAGVGYSVIVSDGYSCDGRVGPIDIVDPTKTIASANITADITCNRTEATVEVSGSGGTGPYEFSIDGVNFLAPNAGLNYIFSVGAGEHNFYVRDTESCISDPRIITINSYTALTATLDTTSAFITCNGDANAVLSANAENGLGNYEYQLLDGSDTPIDGTWQASNSFSNLDVGTYKINVRSTNTAGDVCSVITGQYTINQPLPLVGTAVATQNVTCFGSNTGIITATGQDGNGDYEFNLVSEPSSPEYPENKYVKNGVFENLAAGVYWVTVKDIVGCINAPIRVEIIEPDELEISLVSVTEQVCLNSPTPIITVDVQGGTQPYFVSINNVELATPYNQNQIEIGAAAGIEANTTYLISVRDSGGGCPSKSIAPLTTIESVDLELTVDFEYTCPTGNIIKAIVADKYKNNMSYSLYLGGTLVTTNTTGEFIDVAAGNGYTVTATDTVTSCSESLVSDPIDIEDIQALTMTIDDSQKNKLIANVDFGLPPYSFTVDGVDYEDENEIVILQTKDYTITVTDARGCEVTLTVRGVYVTITVLNLFTPDGDGVNDFWYPLEVENYHNLKVYIFDRYAREITKFRGMQQGWDGTYDGKPLPAGDYWYTLYYNELSGEEKKLMGHFTLYR